MNILEKWIGTLSVSPAPGDMVKSLLRIYLPDDDQEFRTFIRHADD
jgi:hypothetical protein